MLTIDPGMITNKTLRAIGETVKELVCFGLYGFRWEIEVTFMEQKMFWGLNDYNLLRAIGIERLINLQSIVYAFLCMLPYLDKAFAHLRDYSIQERRFHFGQFIQRQQFCAVILNKLQSDKKDADCAKKIEEIARNDTVFFDTGSD